MAILWQFVQDTYANNDWSKFSYNYQQQGDSSRLDRLVNIVTQSLKR